MAGVIALMRYVASLEEWQTPRDLDEYAMTRCRIGARHFARRWRTRLTGSPERSHEHIEARAIGPAAAVMFIGTNWTI